MTIETKLIYKFKKEGTGQRVLLADSQQREVGRIAEWFTSFSEK